MGFNEYLLIAADYLISNLHLQIKSVISSQPNQEDFRPYSILKNIEESLEQYPFQNNGRNLITVATGQDFTYIGNPVLTNHILCNLIKNSLHAISNANKGKITIKLKPGRDFNRLIFRDTASGIPKDFLPKVFELFASQSTSQGGTSVGVTFHAN